MLERSNNNLIHIKKIIEEFYTKARVDILIGYHFNHIEDFTHHLERIQIFWEIHLLLPAKDSSSFNPFHLIHVHLPLKIKKGEVNRWIKLFKETLGKHTDNQDPLILLWNKKLDHFQSIFLKNTILFKDEKH